MRLVKRLALSLAGTGLVTALVAGASYALFTAQVSSPNNTFATGTVSLQDPSTTTTCNVSNIAPGDTSQCTYQVTYTGSLPAWIGLDVASTNSAPDLQLSVTDTNNQSFNLNQQNQVVGSGPVNSNWSDTFTVTATLPTNAGNQNQGKSASVTLTVHAVQSKNNTNNTNTGPVSWS